jgi:hypothetical protein
MKGCHIYKNQQSFGKFDGGGKSHPRIAYSNQKAFLFKIFVYT